MLRFPIQSLQEDYRWSLFKPAAPTGVTATPGNLQATVSWTAPTVLSVTPITDYAVQFSSDSGSTWTTVADGVSTTTSANVTGLTNGTSYQFRVAAINGIGSGAFSAASSAVTPLAFTAIPIMTSATAPSGTASASGIFAAGLDAWHAFDKTAVSGDTTFYASPKPAAGQWLQYDFGSASPAGGYQLTSRQLNPYGSSQAPSAWTLSGSSDGSNFTVIDTQTSQSWTATGQTKSFSLSSQQTWRYWRWTWTASVNTNEPTVMAKVQLTQ